MVQMVRLIRSFLLLTVCLGATPILRAQLFSGPSGGNVFVTPPNSFCLGSDRGTDQVCFKQTGTNMATVFGTLVFTSPPVGAGSGIALGTPGQVPAMNAEIGRAHV